MVSAKGVPLSRWLASKIMKELNIVSCQQPEHRYKKAIKEHVDIPNHLDRQFAVTEPNQIWCGDVTYIWTGKRWAYLAVVLDLFSRKPIGWAMSFSPDSGLTGKALTMAWEARGKPTDVILSTFEQLHRNKMDVFERGIINVFKGLSWDYKTNSPCSFGKKIIFNNLVMHNLWGFSLNWGWRRDQLADLERMLFLLDCKPIPDNRSDISTWLMEHIRDNPTKEVYEDEFFSIRYF